uniref:Reverse transcriptase domain-containing protein n=1 Tax=Oncorhynchus mykiss TaxID=8022 RepID=A0A8K9USR6_ONCMY
MFFATRILCSALQTGQRSGPYAATQKKRLRKRGKRGGLLVRLRRRAHRAPLPSILLANVQSLDNKVDEIRARVAFQRDIRDCNVLCFTETWLTGETLSEAVYPTGFSTHRADRNKHLSGKKRGGGVCLMANVTWCDERNIQELKSFCSPDLEFLTSKCRPHYLPREFSSIIITAVYIPPQADTSMALNELYLTLCKLETIYPEAAFIVAGDFNKANLKTRLPKFYQHIDCATRGGKTLDHCYSNFRDAYKALPRPPFGKADHDSILLIPAYRQKLKQEAPTLRSVQRWSDQADSTFQDCFHHVDWEMFRTASDNIDEYTDSVCEFIRTCVEDVVPIATIKTFLNQKPWIDGSIRVKLKARTTAFNQGKVSGNMTEYKQCSYSLRKAIKQAKRQYRDKVESQFNGSDTRGMWQGLQSITDYRKKSSPVTDQDVLLPGRLNYFFARFEDNTVPLTRPATKTCGLSFTAAEVSKTFKRVNPRKAAGPDGIPSRALRACADQLAGVFTDIFNQSLYQSAVPTCFKRATIVPVPKKAKVTELNDYRPVALTSVIMKCFERLVKDHITSTLPDTLDPLQFAYRPNRSTDDAISTTLHTALTHLDKRNTYVRMLFIDYSSAFNTIVPSKLVIKLETLGLDPALCNWVLDFLTGRPQVVRVGNNISSPLILNTGAPEGCVLSPLLYSLFTHDCVATHASNSIIKFADDTTVVGLITNNDETAYREEVRALGVWCQKNNLTLNVNKTKEMIVDFRKQQREHPPIHIDGTVVERVASFKFLGIHITDKLNWSTHTDSIVKKAQQRLFNLRRLKKFGLSPKALTNFYRCTIESILAYHRLVWQLHRPQP